MKNKWYTRLAAASDKVYQLLSHGRWFSPGTPASSTTKTGRQDIAEILLKVALSTINQIKSIKLFFHILLHRKHYTILFPRSTTNTGTQDEFTQLYYEYIVYCFPPKKVIYNIQYSLH